MSYEVRLTLKAELQLKEAALWWSRNRSHAQAERWYKGFLKAILSLETNPQRCRKARENLAFPVELHELLYGLGRRPTHRAVFVIRPAAVVVYSIRHLAQNDLSLDDI